MSPRRKSQLAWLRAGDVRLVISHQDAQDRRILKALDTLVKAKPAAPAVRTASASAQARRLTSLAGLVAWAGRLG